MASVAQWMTASRLGKRQVWDEAARRFKPAKCNNDTCSNESGYLSLPFCEECALALWAVIDERASAEAKRAAAGGDFGGYAAQRAEADEVAQARELTDAKRRRVDAMTRPGVVYYLRIDGLVKIGFSADLGRRLRQYPPNAALLAQHPGTRETEREMHNKFAAQLAKGREWFTPCQKIDEHIQSVIATYPQPHLMTKGEAIESRRREREAQWDETCASAGRRRLTNREVSAGRVA